MGAQVMKKIDSISLLKNWIDNTIDEYINFFEKRFPGIDVQRLRISKNLFQLHYADPSQAGLVLFVNNLISPTEPIRDRRAVVVKYNTGLPDECYCGAFDPDRIDCYSPNLFSDINGIIVKKCNDIVLANLHYEDKNKKLVFREDLNRSFEVVSEALFGYFIPTADLSVGDGENFRMLTSTLEDRNRVDPEINCKRYLPMSKEGVSLYCQYIYSDHIYEGYESYLRNNNCEIINLLHENGFDMSSSEGRISCSKLLLDMAGDQFQEYFDDRCYDLVNRDHRVELENVWDDSEQNNDFVVGEILDGEVKAVLPVIEKISEVKLKDPFSNESLGYLTTHKRLTEKSAQKLNGLFKKQKEEIYKTCFDAF